MTALKLLQLENKSKTQVFEQRLNDLQKEGFSKGSKGLLC